MIRFMTPLSHFNYVKKRNNCLFRYTNSTGQTATPHSIQMLVKLKTFNDRAL